MRELKLKIKLGLEDQSAVVSAKRGQVLLLFVRCCAAVKYLPYKYCAEL